MFEKSQYWALKIATHTHEISGGADSTKKVGRNLLHRFPGQGDQTGL
jgi:hypothetical protein